ECLRATVVQQMSADVKEGIALAQLAHHVPVPDFLKQGLRTHSLPSPNPRALLVSPPHSIGDAAWAAQFLQALTSTSSIARHQLAHLVHFDDVAVRIVEEDLLPTLHRPGAEVGVGNAVLLEAALEGLDVVGAKGDVTTLNRVDCLAGAKAHAKILLGQ